MTGDQIRLADAARSDRPGKSCIGSDIGAPLLFGHGHADQHPLLFKIGDKTRVINIAGYERPPDCFQCGGGCQSRHHRIGHRYWATVTLFVLSRHHKLDGTHKMPVSTFAFSGRGLGCRFAAALHPGQRMTFVAYRNPHKLVEGWVKLHFVDAIAGSIMAVKNRWVGIGDKTQVNCFGTAHERAKSLESFSGPGGAASLQRFHQHIVMQKRLCSVRGGT